MENVLEDPFLRLYESLPGGGSRRIAVNDDWRTGQDGDAIALAAGEVYAFPLTDFSSDACLLLYLELTTYGDFPWWKASATPSS